VRPVERLPRMVAHVSGGMGAAVVLLFAAGLTVPTAQRFPDSPWTAFHTFFVGVFQELDGLPADHDPDWMQKARPGDILFASRGRTAWGEWTHVAVVVTAPPDAIWTEPGSLAVLDASIHDGMYVGRIEKYREWSRVRVRRVSNDGGVRERIAQAALRHRDGIFVGAARGSAPYTNCTKAALDALASVGIQVDLGGWRVPDEFYRSDVWLD